MIIAPGSTDVTTYFKLVHPTTGVPVTGATITDLDITYVRDRAAATKADLTALAAVDSVHGDNKAIQIDATNAPGLYRVDFPDAAFAAGVARVQLIVNGAAVDPAVIEVELLPFLTPITGATVRAVNGADAALSTYAGADTSGTTELLTRIPDATAGAVGGLPTVDANNYIAGIAGTKNQLDDLNDIAATAIVSNGAITTLTGAVVQTNSVSGSVGSVSGLTAADVGAIKAVTDKVDTAMVLDGAVYQFTANALELAASGTGLNAAQTGDAVLDEVVEGSYTLRQLMRLIAAVIAGTTSGGGTTAVSFTGLDGVTTRITATVDASGNRTMVTKTVT